MSRMATMTAAITTAATMTQIAARLVVTETMFTTSGHPVPGPTGNHVCRSGRYVPRVPRLRTTRGTPAARWRVRNSGPAHQPDAEESADGTSAASGSAATDCAPAAPADGEPIRGPRGRARRIRGRDSRVRPAEAPGLQGAGDLLYRRHQAAARARLQSPPGHGPGGDL